MTWVQHGRRTDLYRAGYIKQKRKDRRTKDEVEAIRGTIKSLLQADHPQTVRQVFYQLVTRDVIEKTENEYQCTVIRLLSEMRLDGQVRWGWIVDESRRTHQTQTFDNIGDALRDTAKYYRRSALRDCGDYIEIWSEKEALAGIIYDVASEYDVPVVVSKGMPSLTQVYGSFCNLRRAARAGKHTYIYQFGDHDPTGCLIPKTIEGRLCEFCERHKCNPPTVERIALTEEQISHYGLPTRPTKRDGNRHAHKFEGDSVELDALPSNELRALSVLNLSLPPRSKWLRWNGCGQTGSRSASSLCSRACPIKARVKSFATLLPALPDHSAISPFRVERAPRRPAT